MAELELKNLNKETSESAEALIAAAELEYKNKVREIAEHIAKNPEIRIILLAGPSGSGKTTSANLIADAIEHMGRESIVVSLDDFYRDSIDPEYPRFESGERDFESPDALHIPDLVATLEKIADGEAFSVPKYDFKVGGRVSLSHHEPMHGGVVIIEGLHALNPKIFSLLPEERLYKIFISVSTNVNDGDRRILSGRKIRFVRRMVRDSIYRGADANRTLSMWKNVLLGEDKYLYPNRQYANLSFDTFHKFELGVMRPLAEELITDELSEREPYAKTVKDALSAVLPISEALVPEDSLIREFIPGGKYEHLY